MACDVVSQRIAAGDSLQAAIEQAHEAVLSEIERRPEVSNMGTTAVALRVQDDAFDVAWVGDSRAYLWDGRLHQLTQDHSYVAGLVARGVLTQAQAAQHPKRHMITQSLGVGRDMALEVAAVQGALAADAQLLLCSDGLTDALGDALIALEMQRQDTPQQQADALLAAALDAGARDNVTVVVLGAKRSRADTDTTLELMRSPNTPRGRGIWLAGLVLAALLFASWLLLA